MAVNRSLTPMLQNWNSYRYFNHQANWSQIRPFSHLDMELDKMIKKNCRLSPQYRNMADLQLYTAICNLSDTEMQNLFEYGRLISQNSRGSHSKCQMYLCNKSSEPYCIYGKLPTSTSVVHGVLCKLPRGTGVYHMVQFLDMFS